MSMDKELIGMVARGDVDLAVKAKAECWTRDVLIALVKIPSLMTEARKLLQRKPVDVGVCVKKYLAYWHACWLQLEGADPRDAGVEHRKMATYHSWFGLDLKESMEQGKRPPLPDYLVHYQNKNYIRNMARFRTLSHCLKVETGRYVKVTNAAGPLMASRQCEVCQVAEDELHVACECRRTAELRSFAGLQRVSGIRELTSKNRSVVGNYINQVMRMYDDLYLNSCCNDADPR